MAKKSTPPEKSDFGSPEDWLRHARSDLALARTRRSRNVLYQHLCFHAQQAAEKAIKAALLLAGVKFPRTHDLAYLMDLLPSDIRIPPTLIDLPTLTKYAVQERYPGEGLAVTQRHRLLAVELAEQAVAWATKFSTSRRQTRQ